MPLYRTNELTFSLPDTLHDKTRYAFGTAGDSSEDFDLSILRTPLLPKETFEEYCKRLHSDLVQHLPKFELHFQRVVLVAGQPSWAIDYRWNDNGHWKHQRQINVLYTAPLDRPMVAQIIATVRGTFTEQWSRAFIEIVNSISFCEPGSIA